MALVHRKLKRIDNKLTTDVWEEHCLGSLEMNVRTDLGRDGRTQGKWKKAEGRK